MKKITQTFIILLLSIFTAAHCCAQCSQIGAVPIGSTKTYDIAPTATRIHWNVSSHGTIIGDRAGTVVTVQWTQAGGATLTSDYYINGEQHSQCYTVPVLSALSGGVISSSITTYPKNHFLQYTAFKNSTEASGSWGNYDGTSYKYQWEESSDGTNWTSIAGATGINCTASNFFDKTLYIRRKVTNNKDIEYSNVVRVDVTSLLNGGVVGTSQVIQAGMAPIKLATILSPGGGDGSYTFQWESSVDEVTWLAIAGAVGNDYQPDALTRTMYFRKKVRSASQSASTNSIQILVKAASDKNIPETNSVQTNQTKVSPPDYAGINTMNLNSVTSHTFLRPGVFNPAQGISLTSKRDISTTTVYMDGLKRKLESVRKDAGYSSQDLVSIAQYDQYGRQILEHLPYLASTDGSTKGTFRRDVNIAQPAFYSALTQHKEDFFYSQYFPEESPAGRSTKSVLPGRSYGGNANGATLSGRMNNAGEHVRIWRIGNSISDVPVSVAEYNPGTLMVQTSTNAENIMSHQYTDQAGRVIMTSQQGTTPDYKDELRTYYVYDDMGNLRYVLPPLVLKGWWTNATWDFASSTETRKALKNLSYKYYYDEKGRVSVMESAGIDAASYFVYDNRDRLVMVQDATLSNRNQGEWVLYFYNGLDRIVMTALYTNPSATRESLQSMVDQASGVTSISVRTPLPGDLHIYNNENKSSYIASNSINFQPGFDSEETAEFEAYIAPTGTEVTETMTVSNPLPGISNYTPLIIYYYDDYNFNGVLGYDKNFTLDPGNNPYSEPVNTPSSNTFGKITGYKKSVPGKTDWIRGTLFYDEKGRCIQQAKTNITGGTDVTTVLFNYTGRILSTFTKVTNPLSVTDNTVFIQQRLEYDDNGNITQKYHSIGNSSTPAYKMVNELSYDELNRVKAIRLGEGLEVLNHEYDLWGRLKSVNAAYVQDKSEGNYFGMELFYDNGFRNKKLDGNISGVIWRRKGSPDAAHAYGYTYDTHQRLTEATYSQKATGSWTNNEEDYTVSMSEYDDNGNILKMKEEGMLPGKVKTTIDDLTYSYEPFSNRLQGVTDSQGDKQQGDFKNYSGRSDANDYTYDGVGNVVSDKNKGINIYYNFLLGKPEKIVFNNDANKYITYLRDITGELLQRTVKNGASTHVYTYVSGAVYKDNVFQYLLFDEGRVRKTLSGNFVYDYFLSDHLGNTRTVITEETNQYYYKASHEDNPDPVPVLPERELFSFPAQVDEIPAGHKFYDYNGHVNRKFVKLNYADANRRIGTGKVLRVMAGDQLELGVLSYYQQNSENNNSSEKPVTDILNQLVNVLLGPAGIIPNGKGNLLQGINGTVLNQEDFNTFIQNNQTDNPPSTTPKAYLNYALFDDNFQLVSGSAIRVSQPGDVVPLVGQLSASKNGYLYIYVSNESNSDVYFDDLVVKHTTGHLLQEDSYYPFGLQIQGLSSAAANRLQNDYLYNGIEKISDLELQLYDAFYRTLDPQTGRWLQIDPVAAKYASLSGYNSDFNNPVNYADPLGDDPPGGGWFSRFLDFFKTRPVNDGNPIMLNLVETFAQKIRSVPIKIESAIVTNSSSLESGVMYTTESYIALEVAAQRRSQLQQSVALRDLYNSLREIHGNNFPTSPSTRIGVVKEYIPDWKDSWGASDNFFAEMTYKPIDGAWTTIQSLNPFLDRSAISHVDGRMATETERVEGMVNITAEVVGNEVIGQGIKVAVPLMGRVVAKGGRGLWRLTKEGAEAIKNHKTFGTIYKSTSDGLWWAVDNAGHGGSKFKVFRETKKGLEWIYDADEFGDFIMNKHKGETGKLIPWDQLSTIK